MMFRAMDVCCFVISHSSLLRMLNCVSVSCSETLLIGQGFQVSQWGVNVKWHELSEAIGPKGLETRRECPPCGAPLAIYIYICIEQI